MYAIYQMCIRDSRRVIHVAGTNGKGSVCAYLNAMLLAQGKTAGMFVSPHLVKMNERIVINGCQIADEDFLDVLDVYKRQEKVRCSDGKEKADQ